MSGDAVIGCSIVAVLVLGAAVCAFAWWDVQRRKLGLEAHAQGVLIGDLAHVKREVSALRELERDADRAVTHGLTELEQRLTARMLNTELRLEKTLAEDTRFADLNQRTTWCEQNIRDLGKTPPKRTAKNHLPSPFGQKT